MKAALDALTLFCLAKIDFAQTRQRMLRRVSRLHDRAAIISATIAETIGVR